MADEAGLVAIDIRPRGDCRPGRERHQARARHPPAVMGRGHQHAAGTEEFSRGAFDVAAPSRAPDGHGARRAVRRRPGRQARPRPRADRQGHRLRGPRRRPAHDVPGGTTSAGDDQLALAADGIVDRRVRRVHRSPGRDRHREARQPPPPPPRPRGPVGRHHHLPAGLPGRGRSRSAFGRRRTT